MAERQPVLVCTAWPYANGSLHVGHLAGVYVPADVFARYQRLRGYDVLMISGTDAHGTPVTVRADQEGVSPAEVAARYHAEFLTYWRDLGISYDVYTTTTTDNHREVVQDEFMMLLDKGLLYKARSVGFYDPIAERFLPDTYIEGECPHCHYARARGNQCENCGRLLEPEDLIRPHSRINPAATLERRETEHFYLDLPKLEKPLLEWARPMHHWRPNVYRFTINFLEGGLQPRAITRDLSWGVPLPPQVGPGWDDKRIYVWFEACSGYLTASIEWAKNKGQPNAWERWWKDPACRQYYFIGKDNIPFHTIIWPAILIGYGNRNLPYDVPANEFMTMSGAKASSSRGNVIWTRDVLDQYNVDTLRYYLSATAPEGRDTDFTFDELIRRNNDELVANYGNAVHRTLTFLQSKFGGVVPYPQTLREADREILAEVDGGFSVVGHNIANCHFKDGLNAAMAVTRAANRYLDEQAPWKQIKVDRDAAGTTLYVMLQVISGLRVMFSPYLPFSSQKLHHLLGFEGDVSAGSWRSSEVPAGTMLPVPSPLFPKLEELANV